MDRDIVVIGGSAGALDPLKQVISELPPGLPAAVFVVLHIAATQKSLLGPILNRLGGMSVATPRDGDPVQPGYLYVPMPDHHMELRDGTVHLSHGPRVNGMRPAVDNLFRSAAAAYDSRVVAVVLSGGLDDGSAGMAAIRAAGGIGIVQSPEDAIVDSMPRNAIAIARPQLVLPSDQIAAAIASAVGGSIRKESRLEMGGAEMEPVGAKDAPGQVTGITCPDCHGSIWLQTGDGGEVALTCRVGHSYSPESFVEIQAANVEDALWAGIRSLEEQATLAAAMASRASKLNDPQSADRAEQRRKIAEKNARVLRDLVLERPGA